MALLLAPGLAWSAVSAAVKVDQVGYLPNQPKLGILTSAPTGSVVVRDTGGNPVLTVAAGAAAADADSGDTVRVVDFSALTTPGTYYLDAPGLGTSYNFTVGNTVYSNAWYQIMRFYYGQRCGTAVNMGNGWSHAACHMADATFDASAGKTGTKVSTKGWHDAGDYGKYSVNAGISTGEVLSTYEWFSNLIGNVNLGIPESGNGIPDVLNEAKWELDWWLTMQDTDGGVWNKVTTLAFPAFIMPEADTATRYIIGTGSGSPYKETTSTADFAAVMAIAARLFQPYNPTYAATCLAAAQNAYTWAIANPNVLVSNPADCSTGNYGDSRPGDELLWAAAELFHTTGTATYNSYFTSHYTNWNPVVGTGVMDWATVTNMAMWTYYFSGQASANATALSAIQSATLAAANSFVTRSNANGYRVTLSGSGDYIWGSNGWLGNQALLLVVANRMQPTASYINTAAEDVHYLFGRNTFDMSFATNLGTAAVMNPHHRPSGADGVTAPWPGMVAGGPNSGGGDGGITPSSPNPARCYTDQQGAYASNEVALNWNSPWVFVLAALQAGPSGSPTMSPTQSRTFTVSPVVTATPTITVTLTPTSTFTPDACAPAWRLRCGAAAAYTDTLGNVWQADRAYTTGGYGSISSTGGSSTNAISGTTDQALYQSEGYGNPVDYRFDVPNGLYHVTLKFAEFYFTATGQRVFNVAINGATVISDLDLVAVAGANAAYDRDFWVTVTGGSIDIQGSPSVNNAKIDAIQVVGTSPVCTPVGTLTFSPTRSASLTTTRSLTASPTFSFSPTVTQSLTLSPSFTLTPSATITPTLSPTFTPNPCAQAWRVRTGGTAAYTDSKGNVWQADQAYTAGSYGYISGASGTSTNTITGTSDPALYQTERYGNPYEYRFDVPNGLYHVTLKMCDFYFTTAGSRVFSVAINGATVISNLDLVATAGANAAYDRDFWITVTGGTLDIVGTATADTAMINAVEVDATTGACTPTSTYSPSPLASPTASFTVTRSFTASPSPTLSPSPTATPTRTFSESATWTPSLSATSTRSQTPTASPTRSPSSTISATPTLSGTITRTFTPVPPDSTPTSTATPSPTPSPSPTLTLTASPTCSLSPSASSTPSASPTATPTGSPSVSASLTPTFVTPADTPTLTLTTSPTPDNTVTSQASYTPTPTPSSTPTLAAGPPQPGALDRMVPFPNPDPGTIYFHSTGRVDGVELRIYTVGMLCVQEYHLGVPLDGWQSLSLAGFRHGRAKGAYYAAAWAAGNPGKRLIETLYFVH